MKKLFIYYSLTGNGDIIAEYLKGKGYEIRKVETSETLPKNNILRIISGGYKTMINYEDKLIDFNDDISPYEEILIGSPIWNFRLSSPINTVLKLLELKNKKVKFILYSGSNNCEKINKKIVSQYPNIEIINLSEPKNNKSELNKLKL